MNSFLSSRKGGLLTTLLIFLFITPLKAQNWHSLGPDDSNQPGSSTTHNDIAVDQSGNIYIALVSSHNGRVSVRKYDGSRWSNLGNSPVSNFAAGSVSIALDGQIPYLAFANTDNGSKAAVMTLDGDNWITAGTPEVSADAVENLSVAVNDGIPYVIYKGKSDSKATVKKLQGSDWLALGSDGFTNAIETPALAFLATTPYVAYADKSTGKASVMKFENNNWMSVGTPSFTADWVWNTSIVFCGTTPYVVFEEGVNHKTTVMKFNGSTWQPAGNTQFADGRYLSIDASSSDVYLLYSNASNDGKPEVKKYDGSSWTDVGSSGLFDEFIQHSSIFVRNNTPYIIFQDTKNTGRARVQKLENNTWVSVWEKGFSTGKSSYNAISFSGTVPYVAFSDLAQNNKVSVKKFDGEWKDVGPPGISEGGAEFCDIAMSNGTPYVIYQDENLGERATVKAFIADNWITVGNQGFSTGAASYTSLAINNGIPYVIYSDEAQGKKAVVMTLSGTAWKVLGDGDVSDEEATNCKIVFHNNIPYVVFIEKTNSEVVVKKFDGIDWIKIEAKVRLSPDEEVPLSSDGQVDLVFNQGIPYLVLKEYVSPQRISVVKLDGDKWEYVGSDLGIPVTDPRALHIDFINNTPYVGYEDGDNRYRFTVKKFTGGNWVNAGQPAFTAATSFYPTMAANSGKIYAVYSDYTSYARVLNEGDGPLPVKLISFSAIKQNDQVMLRWETGWETDNDGFVIERAGDDGQFRALLNLQASASGQYSCYDIQPLAGINYYKLIQVDKNGTRSVLDLKEVLFSMNKEKVKAYPNPLISGDKLYLQISDSGEKEFTIRVCSNAGVEIHHEKIKSQGQDYVYSINLKNSLAPGFYVLQISGKNGFRKSIGLVRQ
mgnify:FL=1